MFVLSGTCLPWETLYINKDNDSTVLAEFDLSGCSRLRRLPTNWLIAERLLISSDCEVSFGARGRFLNAHDYKGYKKGLLESATTRSHVALADRVCMFFGEMSQLQALQGIFGHLSHTELLSIWWPGDEEEMPIAETASALQWMMPANGEPLLNLRTIIIQARTMKGVIPANLPNLEELVISAEIGWSCHLKIHRQHFWLHLWRPSMPLAGQPPQRDLTPQNCCHQAY